MEWTVERVELFFYHGVANRWEMFEEGAENGPVQYSAQPETFFRDQLKKLLATIRNAFWASTTPAELGERTMTCSSAGEHVTDSVIVSKESRLQETMVQIGIGRWVDKDVLKQYTSYCRDALKHEGVDDKHLATFLKRLAPGRSESLQMASVPNLLSVLPIARDWDVFGWLQPMSTSAERFEPVRYWRRFFVYRVGLQAPSVPNDTGPSPRTLHQPLDHDVSFQMLGEKKKGANPPSIAALERQIPYFDFAKTPTAAHLRQSPMQGEEFKLYRVYGDIIDGIQRATGTFPGAGKQQNNYYVVYPVIACGYYHFFQLKVAPSAKIAPQAGLRRCKAAFINVLPLKGKNTEFPILKESLRELLVQIRLSAFQHYVSNWKMAHAKGVTADPEKLAKRCFCELAPLINEMRAIGTSDSAWTHGGAKKPITNTIDQVLQPWREVSRVDITRDQSGVRAIARSGDQQPLLANDYHVETIPNTDVQVWLFHRGGLTRFVCECFAGTNMRRLEEQYFAVKERFIRYANEGRH